jgi:RHS repeat-associated protein
MLRELSRNRLLALFTLVPLVWFSIDGVALSAAYQVARQKRDRILEMAKNLKLDPDLLLDPEGYRAGQLRIRNEKRSEILKSLGTTSGQSADVKSRIAHVHQSMSGKRLDATFAHVQEYKQALTRAAAGDKIARGRIKALSQVIARDAEEARSVLDSQRQLLSGLRNGGELNNRHDRVSGQLEATLKTVANEASQLDPASATSSRLRSLAARLPSKKSSAARQSTYQPSFERLATPAVTSTAVGSTAVQTTSLTMAASALQAQAHQGAADILPSPEGVFTQQIQALAQNLNNDPVAIYKFLLENFESELYFGVRKGAAGTLLTQSGNDADLSALLVALLRVSNIPARYRYARVELTPAQAMQMAGTTDIRIAGDAFASAGFHAGLHWEGDVCKGLQIDHVYVAAYVPYTNYRGTAGAENKPMWIELDPWLVRHQLTDGSDLSTQVPFNRSEYLSTVQTKGPLGWWEDKLLTWAQTHGRTCENLDFAMRKRVRDPVHMNYLPSSVPATMVTLRWEDLILPANMTATVKYEVLSETNQVLISHQGAGYEVFGAPISLVYVPATAADEELINTYGSIVDSPPYLLKLKPRLVMGSSVLAEAAAVGAGAEARVRVTVQTPGLGTRVARYPTVAGETLTTAWLPGPVPAQAVNAQEQAMTQALVAGDTTGAKRIKLGLMVLGQLYDDARSMEHISALLGQRVQRQLSAGAAWEMFNVTYGQSGMPVSMALGSYLLDIQQNVVNQYGLTKTSNSAAAQKAGMELMGLEGSHLERAATERQLNGRGYSTVLALQSASTAGQPLMTVNQSNAATVIPSLALPDEVKGSMLDAVNAGSEILLHPSPVAAAGFVSVIGYIAENPKTGAAAYKIGTLAASGCQGGEGSSNPLGDNQDQCSCTCTSSHSTVNVASGNYYFEETDVVLPAVGIPVSFTRRYNSRQYASGALGSGWTHNFEIRLTENQDGSVSYVNEEGYLFTFAKNGPSYNRPAGRYWDLTKIGAGWIMQLKGGMVYTFDTSGRLLYQDDNNGNRIALSYASGRLDKVIDATGREALTFAYDAVGKLTRLQDAASRTIVFGHDPNSGDLTSVTDTLGQSLSYSYDSNHRLIQKTDFNGNAYTYSFDSQGRCYRMEDPAGGVKSISYDFENRQAVVTDETGQESLHAYNENGNPTEIVDPVGNRRQMSWDADYKKQYETDGRGLTTTFGYDSRGNLLTRTAPGEGATTYTYDPLLDRVLTIQDSTGGVTTNSYDTKGNLVSSKDAAGNETTYSYQPTGLPDTITRPGSIATGLGYDGSGNLSSLTTPDSGVTTLGYDPSGHITSIRDALQYERKLETNAKGQITAIVDPEGKRTELTYDSQGNRLTMKDPQGNITTFGYDKLNRLTTTTDPFGAVTRTEYDLAGRVIARVDAKGYRTQYRYDSAGRLEQMIGPDGGVTSLGYCADVSASCSTCGGGGASAASQTKACLVIDPEGSVTRIDYDAAGRPTTVTDALGNQTITTYDTQGRKTSVTDAEGKTTQYRYFVSGQLWQVQDALGGITEYGYDNRGNRVLVRDANGHDTRFEYDSMDRLTKETNPLGKETIFTYDKGGNRVTKLDPNGNVIQYSYDSNRRLTDILYPDLSATHFAYDDRGNKTYEENQQSARTYQYDQLNRVIQVTDEILHRTIQYEYDQNGNRTKMIGPDGETTMYYYDAFNRIKQIVDPDGGKTIFTHDKSGKRLSLQFANGVTGAYFYDQANRLQSIVYKNTGGDVLQSFTYLNDKVGNRLAKTFATGESESYGYDDLHRLAAVTYPTGRHVTYQYDPVGNRQYVTEAFSGGGSDTTSYTYSDFNQVLSTINSQGTTSYAWDDNGNLIGKQTPAGEITQYNYNFENRLISILYANGSTNAFGYDPQGIRVFKEDSQGRTNYLIDQVSVLAEYTALGSKKAWYNSNPQRIDEILSQVQTAGKFYHLVDGLGSVTGLVNQAQAKVAAYTYDVYGALTDQQVQPGIQNPYLFTGRELDRDSELQYNRARYYQSGVGSWNSEDPIGRDIMLGSATALISTLMSEPDIGLSLNRFLYSIANPARYTDPHGMFFVPGALEAVILGLILFFVILMGVLTIAMTIAFIVGDESAYEQLKNVLDVTLVLLGAVLLAAILFTPVWFYILSIMYQSYMFLLPATFLVVCVVRKLRKPDSMGICFKSVLVYLVTKKLDKLLKPICDSD